MTIIEGGSVAYLKNEKGVVIKLAELAPTPMVGTRLADAWNDAAGTPGGLTALLSRVKG